MLSGAAAQDSAASATGATPVAGTAASALIGVSVDPSAVPDSTAGAESSGSARRELVSATGSATQPGGDAATATAAVVDGSGASAASAGAAVGARHSASTVGGDSVIPPDSHDTVVILLPEMPAMDAPGALEAAAEFFANPTWLPDLAGVRDCWLVTVGGEQVTSGDPVPHQFHGAVTAGFRCLGMESLGVSFRRVDLAAGQADASRAAALVRAVHVKNEPELALRDGAVYAKRLEIDAVQRGPARDADLAHVVIVGGTGTLGVEFCAHYARSGAGRITLLSRSGETAEVTRRLRPIRALGDTPIIVESCDVTDADAVVELAERQEIPATVLVHAGVNYVRAELAEVTPEKFREMAGSKIYGTEHMLHTWPRTPDCRIVLCSSAAATFGGRGQILYATVNRMLDVLARRLRAAGVDAVAVQWGLWDLEGPLHAVGTGPVQAAGVTPMRAADALAVGFTDHADHSGAENRLVAAADWSDVQALMVAIGQGPLLDDVVAAAAESAVVQPDSPGSGHRDGNSPRIAGTPADGHRGTADSAAYPSGPDRVRATVAQGGTKAMTQFRAAAGQPGAAGGNSANLAERVRRQLGRVMGADADALDPSVPLVALGLDSLQALDFRKRVQVELDRDLPVAAILGGASLDDVVRLMAGSQA
ncbi:SDR family NAD(P)-dependent oxidoreductase [Nocardia sp. ET3-3]|uniref:SDR family NAD(P)-dependent oxidoreductase n=1 Tax=Nocardia terrae TaxID=2675851 RepID=A0A7K1UYQ7_9NOCA|nr:SDR family NAD(P)-dependent oxidoreductase [Nocardia terrae]